MKYIIVSQDRHRDDIVYSFEGSFEEAKKIANKLLDGMRNYEVSVQEWEDEHLCYSIYMMDGDYGVQIYKPIKYNANVLTDETEDKNDTD